MDLTNKDLSTIERLLKNPDWVIPPEVFQLLPNLLVQTITEQKDGKHRYSVRDRNASARILMQLVAHNQRNNPATQTVEVHVSGDMEKLREGCEHASDEELAKLAAAADVMDSMMQRLTTQN